MKVDSITDIGIVRSHNEDAVQTGMKDDAAWAIVCDGMGGANAGEIASSSALRKINERIEENYSSKLLDDEVKELLISAVCESNKAVYGLSKEYENFSGMGTTAVVALMRDNQVFICHVGDSRAYLITDKGIKQLTKDHSVVQELVDSGNLTPEEARTHPSRNIITRTVGVYEDVDIDFCTCDLVGKSLILLCSDGLTSYVTDEELHQMYLRISPADYIKTLVELALIRGGSDNITIGIIEN